MNTYIARALAAGGLELRTGVQAQRVLIEGSGERAHATGVEYLDAQGHLQVARGRFVVVAAGALNTSLLLLRSGLTNPAIGRHVGLHPVRLVHGLFDDVQDAYRVYPISAHCMQHQVDADGGFVLEASTIMDPIAFATTSRDEHGPLWGQRLVDALRAYRRWVGVLAMVNDENNGAIALDANGQERITVDFQASEHARLDAALDFSRRVLQAAGARQVCWTGIISTHTQGGCRMGDDPARAVVDRNGRTHEVQGLYVGDSALLPRTLSVNPSLTIMALATRLAMHLEGELAQTPAPH